MRDCPAFKTTGANAVMPGFTAPKLLWLQRHEPELFSKIDKVLLPKDYIRYCLTGDLATDVSDAAGTLWLDVEKRKWSDVLLGACHLTEAQMPTVYEGTQITGTLKADIATSFGMIETKIAAGASDNAAGGLSMGVIHDGQAMLSLGTSGVYFVAADDFHADPSQGLHSFCHCVPNTYHQMGVILSAASALSWWQGLHPDTSIEALIQEAKVCDKTHTPTFLPYLSGERTPHNNPHLTGSFTGLTQNTTRAHMTQAILEGVAFAFADCQQVIEDAGVNINTISVVGGGARSTYWGTILASVLGRRCQYHKDATVGPAFGAARLALISSGASVESVATAPPIDFMAQPDSALGDELAERLVRYRSQGL
jgi:xylulokinase